MKKCLLIFTVFLVALCHAEGRRLLRGGTNAPAPVTVELTDREKAFDLDSFAGFKFGEIADSSSPLYRHRTRSIKLDSPIRAFTNVQVGYTSFNPRLCSVHISGSVKDWDKQSISNEVAAVRNFLSSRYGISAWKYYGVVVGFRGDENMFKFENDNLSISIRSSGAFISLYVESKRIAKITSKEKEAARKPVSFSGEDGFSELAQLADKVKVLEDNEIKPTIPSGEAGDIGLSGGDSTAWESSEVGGKDQIIFLPCRSESEGNRGRIYWRPFVISPDGRIRKIEKEQDSYTKYYGNV